MVYFEALSFHRSKLLISFFNLFSRKNFRGSLRHCNKPSSAAGDSFSGKIFPGSLLLIATSPSPAAGDSTSGKSFVEALISAHNKSIISYRGLIQRKGLSRGSLLPLKQATHQLQGICSAERLFFEAPSSLQQALLPQQGIRSEERFLPGSIRFSSRLSKASLPLFKLSSEGPCKASARDPALSSNLLVKGYARAEASMQTLHNRDSSRIRREVL